MLFRRRPRGAPAVLRDGLEVGRLGRARRGRVRPATLPHVLAADCLLPMADRQRLLEQTSPTERLRMVRALLAREAGLLAQLRAVPTPITTYAVEHSNN